MASGGSPVSLPDVSSTEPLGVNEGLKLLAILNEAIVEDYSVKYAINSTSERVETIDDYAGEAILTGT